MVKWIKSINVMHWSDKNVHVCVYLFVCSYEIYNFNIREKEEMVIVWQLTGSDWRRQWIVQRSGVEWVIDSEVRTCVCVFKSFERAVAYSFLLLLHKILRFNHSSSLSSHYILFFSSRCQLSLFSCDNCCSCEVKVEHW